jgi:peptidoglycan/LPS O-acetylase OafA/YrhL
VTAPAIESFAGPNAVGLADTVPAGHLEVVHATPVVNQRPAARFSGLDGLRALAVLAVVIYHFQPTALPGGFLGVDLFFVISGYLITRLLLGEIDHFGDLSIPEFYLRRARRLLPALLVLIGVVTLAGVFVWRDELPSLRGGVPASLGYVANWWLIGDHQSYFVSSGRPPMLQHLWSLAIEEQFYLIWPLALTVLIGADLRRRRTTVLSSARLLLVAAVSIVLALASTAAMVMIAVRSDVPYGADSGRVYFGTDTHSMGLLLGAAAGALAIRARFGIPKKVLRGAFLSDLLALAAGAALVWTMLRVDEFAPGLYRGGFLAVSALCMVLVAAVTRRHSLLGWLLDRRTLRWLGARSYAIYLWHWPIAVVTRPDLDIHAPALIVLGIRVLLTMLLADLSYRLVERPIRQGGLTGLARAWHVGNLSLTTRSRLAPVALMAVLVVVIGSVFGLLPTNSPTHSRAATPVAPPSSVAPPILAPPSQSASPARAAALTPAAATITSAHAAAPAPKAAVTVSAFGDSVMLGASPALLAKVPRLTVDAVEGRQARVVFADIAARLKAGTLGSVVVIHTGNNGIVSPTDLTAALRSLAGRRVVLVTDRVPRDWQSPNDQLLARTAAKYPNVVLLDWYRDSAAHRGWFYGDGLHLRPAGAAAYAALVAAAIR